MTAIITKFHSNGQSVQNASNVAYMWKGMFKAAQTAALLTRENTVS